MPRHWLEVWARPGDPSFGRVIDGMPVTQHTLHDGVNLLGDGSARVPNTFTRFDEILSIDVDTPASSVSSLCRIFSEDDPTTPVFEWLPRALIPETSKIDSDVNISGLGIKSILDYARTEAHDWDGSDDFIPIQPDWQFGNGVNLLRNPDFENVPMVNGGFEDGDLAGWGTTTLEGIFQTATLLLVKSSADARSGDYYGLVSPSTADSGARRTIGGLVPGKTYTIIGYMRDPTASGDNFRAGVSAVASASHTNAYEASGYWWAEVDNAVQGAGASDGTWQSFTITFIAADTTVTLVVVFADAGAGPVFRIDDWTVSGEGTGLDPWVRFAVAGSSVNTLEYTTARSYSGIGSAKLQVTDVAYTSPVSGLSGFGNAGIQQKTQLEVGKRYTAEIWVLQESGSDQDFEFVIRRDSPVGEVGTPGSTDMAADVSTIPSGAWTRQRVEFVADVELVSLVSSWAEAGGASPVWYVDLAALYEGLPATTAGDITTLLYDTYIDPVLRFPIVWDDGSVSDTPYLTLDYSDALDSGGIAWAHSEIRLRIWMRMTLRNVLDQLSVSYGYEWRVVPDNVENGTWTLQLYNPGTMKTDHTSAATPAIQGGASDVRRQIRRFLPSGTETMVEGLSRVTARDRDTGLVSALGRIETARIDRELPSLESVIEAVYEDSIDILKEGVSYPYVLIEPQDTPLSSYVLGDLLTIEDPPEVQDTARLWDVIGVFTPQSEEWEVDFAPASQFGS